MKAQIFRNSNWRNNGNTLPSIIQQVQRRKFKTTSIKDQLTTLDTTNDQLENMNSKSKSPNKLWADQELKILDGKPESLSTKWNITIHKKDKLLFDMIKEIDTKMGWDKRKIKRRYYLSDKFITKENQEFYDAIKSFRKKNPKKIDEIMKMDKEGSKSEKKSHAEVNKDIEIAEFRSLDENSTRKKNLQQCRKNWQLCIRNNLSE